MLHILSVSPWRFNFKEMIRIMKTEDDLLLIQDGVFGAIVGSQLIKVVTNIPTTISVLKEDINARGILNKIPSKIHIIEYTNFVDLTVKHTNQIYW